MKLNPDCVRDVLIYLEDNLTYVDEQESTLEHKSIVMNQIANNLHNDKGYDLADIYYSIEKLLEINYIKASNYVRGNRNVLFCEISDITWTGHEFLNTIRPDSIWAATKAKAKQIGGMSIQGLTTLASELMKNVITHPDVVQNIVDKIKEFLV